ncbi:hypothetical protein E2C01_032153 [Portunus trituberculatus]|uniref:Uncharacterized protein n=1 Tax=Portunus trituberculatus TaxID=210409 RepID=A0A5B7EWS3_PORTR|nr:hypothetical protein [Portunus trituberculatus]
MTQQQCQDQTSGFRRMARRASRPAEGIKITRRIAATNTGSCPTPQPLPPRRVQTPPPTGALNPPPPPSSKLPLHYQHHTYHHQYHHSNNDPLPPLPPPHYHGSSQITANAAPYRLPPAAGGVADMAIRQQEGTAAGRDSWTAIVDKTM